MLRKCRGVTWCAAHAKRQQASNRLKANPTEACNTTLTILIPVKLIRSPCPSSHKATVVRDWPLAWGLSPLE